MIDLEELASEDKITGRLSAAELRAMALRQQAQIDSQQQLLAAKEQRLRALRAQEARVGASAAAREHERLRRLRERAEAQESKLRRLRALRGQVDLQKGYNVTLSSDLDSIRALFSEKEKELSVAAAKVEALTRQLEELRRGRRSVANGVNSGGAGVTLSPTNNGNNSGGYIGGQRGDGNGEILHQAVPSPAARELEKLRRELLYRNQVALQQDARLQLQRETLHVRRLELRSVDRRIAELQGRLHRQRNGPPAQRLPGVPPRGNVAAIEPYNHTPTVAPVSEDQQQKPQIKYNQQVDRPTYPQQPPPVTNLHKPQTPIADEEDFPPPPPLPPPMTNESEPPQLQRLSEFALNKSDPKYQTLPYNTKFSVNYVKSNSNVAVKLGGNVEQKVKNLEDEKVFDKSAIDGADVLNNSNKTSLHGMTVHSTPLSGANKSVATPLGSPNTDSSSSTTASPAVVTSSIVTSMVTTVAQSTNVTQQAAAQLTSPLVTQTSVASPVVMGDATRPPRPVAQIKSIGRVIPQSKQTTSIPQVKQQPPPRPPRPPVSHTEENDKNIANSVANSGSKMQAPQDTAPSNNISCNQQLVVVQQSPAPTQTQQPVIRARPLTIRKQPACEQPKLRKSTSQITASNTGINNANQHHASPPVSVHSSGRRIEIPPSFMFPEVREATPTPPIRDQSPITDQSTDFLKKCTSPTTANVQQQPQVALSKTKLSRRVSFDPLALLLDASLEGELELVKKTASQVADPSAANDEGITALHNAICAGHQEIVKFLVEYGCDVNAQDSDGWTPLHCAASCNNLMTVRFLVERGACLFAATLSDRETPAEKCEEDEEGFDGCSEYLYSVQEKLGILNNGEVYAVFAYEAGQPDELSFALNEKLTILRKGDEAEREWWWARCSTGTEGYVPRNLLGLYPRVDPPLQE